MKGFVQNIEDISVENDAFRRVLYTAKNCQLVVMALQRREERGLGPVAHFRIEKMAASGYAASTIKEINHE